MTAEQDGIRCMQLRGGTSKGAYFLPDDLPSDPVERDDLLLRIMGSPDGRQIDGIGGGHPLTSKVAVVSISSDPAADVDYLFLQVVPDQAVVTDAQTCGNLLAGVAPFALERGIVPIETELTAVRIRIMNRTVSFAEARVRTPGGRVEYDGDTVMAGTPFPAAGIDITFPGTGESIFPTGRLVDSIGGLEVTCVDAGMPVVLVLADDLGITGTESPTELEANVDLRARVEAIRVDAGVAMGLGDVTQTTVPKVSILSSARNGGDVSTRTFIPRRVHTSIGVLGAVSVAAGALARGTIAERWATSSGQVRIEHPTGSFTVTIELEGRGADTSVRRSAVVRTARKLFDGLVWPRGGRALS